MDSYELEADQVIDWAINYADYSELEKVAKALYAHYVERRKREHPEQHKAAEKGFNSGKRGWRR